MTSSPTYCPKIEENTNISTLRFIFRLGTEQ